MEINNKDKNGLHVRPNDALMFMSSNKEIRTQHTWHDILPHSQYHSYKQIAFLRSWRN